MKKITLFSTLCFLLFTLIVNAQIPPNAFNYSAVARNAAGQPIATTTIGIQITILKTSPTGASQYSENHFVNTDAFGLFNLVIGAGAVQSGSMATIDWSNDNYYLKVGMDASGGTNFLTMGTTQLLSVPYALHSKTAESLVGGSTGFSGNYNDLTNIPILAPVATSGSYNDLLNNPITVSSISAGGDTLYLSNGQIFVAGSNTGGTGALVLPTITTNAVTGITSNSATFGGAISNANGNQIMERGIVYSTTPNPTIGSNKIVIGNGIGTFDTITSMYFYYPHFLQPSTQYYVRAYAVTENNISAYGNELSFLTLALTPPTITTNSMTGITSNSATFGGAISNANGNQIMERGIVYSTSPNPTLVSNKIVIGNGIGTFDTISALYPSYPHLLNSNNTYYVRAYAVTENNISAYGNEVSFTTLSVGQAGPGGGIIFFNKGNSTGGWQYLETAQSDQSTGIDIEWGCTVTSIPGTQLAVGSGETNTSLIVAGCNEATFAAKICNDLVSGGQTDWFLPSRDELNMMYKNLYTNNQGNLYTNSIYWSSSEYSNDSAWALGFGFYGGGQMGTSAAPVAKWATRNVRAVRAF
jgi:hypothetical protein